LSFGRILLTNESNARFGQQQYFFCENQHKRPSPLSFSNVLKHPSGHELPIKQNGAIPYHLHSSLVDIGVRIKIKNKNNIDETIIIYFVIMDEEKEYRSCLPLYIIHNSILSTDRTVTFQHSLRRHVYINER
jgi:hypothetical protein